MTTATPKQAQAESAAPSAAAPMKADAMTDSVENLSDEQLLKMLADMMLIRRFEERTMQAYQQAKIGGFCHIYIGQEATAVGSIAATNNDDPIVSAYRDHGHALARGMHPNYCHGRDVRQDHRLRQGQGRLDAHVR